MKNYKINIALIQHSNKSLFIYSGLTLQQLAFSNGFHWPSSRFHFICPDDPELDGKMTHITFYFNEGTMRYNDYPSEKRKNFGLIEPVSFAKGVYEILLQL